MRNPLKLAFSEFWQGFDPHSNLLTNLIRREFNVEVVTENADLLIYSCYGFEFLKYNCPKIFYTAENVRPNFRECDYALSYDYDDYNGKNLRLPLYLFSYLKYLEKGKELDLYLKQKTKFCNLLVSNPNCKKRNKFFELLNEQRQVDSGGKYKNNLGKPIENKMDFIADYRFSIAFENNSFPGYTTEKIVHPMLVGSIPIY